MTQLDLQPIPGRTDTSRSAAASLSRGAVKRDERDILTALAWRNMTRPELEAVTNIKLQSLTARLRGLVKAGKIQWSGAKRPSPNGVPCHEYELVREDR
jgi:uncharacterized protein with von Willebrand factor type A (vWA) domain